MPAPQRMQYNEAIQNLRQGVSDEELRGGELAVNAFGLPLVWAGGFADVYRVHCPQSGSTWAVKCFVKETPRLRERYREISAHLHQAGLPFTVDFQIVEPGLRVGDRWVPILKMRWVEGLTLNQFVSEHLDRPRNLRQLLEMWPRLAMRLHEAGMAHGDLQHGNVLLVPVPETGRLSLNLVDYDGMFVPALAGFKTGEVGHPAYQHPQRLREAIYNAQIDRFSHLAIYTAIQGVMVGGEDLWRRNDNGDNLLFREMDYQNPGLSATFQQLWDLGDAELQALTGHLILAAEGPLEQVPLLDQIITGGQVQRLAATQQQHVERLLFPSRGSRPAHRPPVLVEPEEPAPTEASPQPLAPAGPLVVTCVCGSSFKAAPHLYGKQVPCPVCRAWIDVPRPAVTDSAAEPLADLTPAADPSTTELPLTVPMKPPQWYVMMMWKLIGPVTSKELKTMAAEGNVKRDTPVRLETHDEWTPAESVTSWWFDNDDWNIVLSVLWRKIVAAPGGVYRFLRGIPGRVDRLLGRLAGEGNTILHNFLRVAAPVCVVTGVVLTIAGTGYYFQTQRQRERVRLAQRAAETAKQTANAAFVTQVRPRSWEQGQKRLAEAVTAIREADLDVAERLLGEASARFAQAVEEAPGANAFGQAEEAWPKAEKAWSSGLAVADEEILKQYPRGGFEKAQEKVATARHCWEAGDTSAAGGLFQEAVDTATTALEQADSGLYALVVKHQDEKHTSCYLGAAPLQKMNRFVLEYQRYLTKTKMPLDLKLALSISWGNTWDGYKNDVVVTLDDRPLIYDADIVAQKNKTSNIIVSGGFSAYLSDNVRVHVKVVRQAWWVGQGTADSGSGSYSGTVARLRNHTIELKADGHTNQASFHVTGIPVEPPLPPWRRD